MISFSSRSWLPSLLFALVGVGGLGGCKKKATTPAIQTATVMRRDIMVSTEATGTVEPVDTVAVKSQASGLIIKMPIEVGTVVKVGDLIAQIDTRNLTNDYQRAAAAQQAAQSSVEVNQSVRKRADLLLQQGVITTAEHETAVVSEANAKSALVAAQTNLRVAQQNLDYATVRAEVAGTVISKGASVGTVVSSATSNVGGGSTIVTVADLSRVRMRVLVNETDIANVHPGQAAKVTVDALPSQTFNGVVEKIEPQAVIQQSVTMFPVLVSLANPTQALLPGMNGEVTMITQERTQVLAVPNDALRSGRDIAAVGQALGVNMDSLKALMQNRRQAGGQGATAGANGSVRAGGHAETDGTVGVRNSAGTRRNIGVGESTGTRGVVDSARRMAGAGRHRGAGAARTDSSGSATRTGVRNTGANSAAGVGAASTGADVTRTRGVAQFAFVKEGTTWVPHRVRVGITNYDYTEVLGGLQEGDEVALLAVLAVQQQRDQQTQRVRSMTGNGLPGASTSGGGRGR